ncbi:hypothetical protein JRG66_11260 [Salinimicrobium tongyeongense]|jgi:hypothetical protein|uniref:Uncharacterized protein n=1 Tax=Salinimicrobium tongyeongense TaxID=2809707 RepID=A0ABY6NPE8_9FLAO|nr:hypothetical protein [Salinimicrobium tongyeongense]UZH54551.1 hypothetical protein JRG66_11260 [Salinimicrobium tongyeongense]
MESQIIEKLLDRYFEAETTGEEETTLKNYFRSEEVAPHLQQYIPMFCFFDQAKTEKLEKEVSYAPQQKKLRFGRKKVYSWVAIAASIVIFLGVVVQQENQVSEFGTYEDPELAMQKTREALEMMSLYMNAGTEDLGYLEEFNNTKDKIVK